jgi:DNA replication protein DnaC
MEQSNQIQEMLYNEIPSWLTTPPSASVPFPPVKTRQQGLPFEQLHWEDFEKLCLRFVRLEADIEHCALYGRCGQTQHGIDIFARKSLGDKYRVYQCRRVESFDKRKIKVAVSTFLNGKWAGKSESFVLSTSLSLRDSTLQDTIETQSQLLKKNNISFVLWDRDVLNLKLKDSPEIVDDFFGREWVKAFCGEDKADSLGTRLDGMQVAEFRRKLQTFYRNLFNIQDPGLITATQQNAPLLSLEERYVFPDVYEERDILVSADKEKNQQGVDAGSQTETAGFAEAADQASYPVHQMRMRDKTRRTAQSWLAQNPKSILLGEPGSGKTSLLRFVALDLLSEEPRLSELAQRFDTYLPVWVPFGLWTSMISAMPTAANSLMDMLQLWFRKWDEMRLWPLVEKALSDDRLLLLVDGLDEWTNVSAGKIALEKLQVFVSQHEVPIITTSRPLGFNKLGMPTAGWQVAQLADFSKPQQEELVRTWFKYWARNTLYSETTKENELASRVTGMCEEFLAELATSTDIADLARVPLLLVLLIYNWLQKSKLPRNRFKAYDQMIDHLIVERPRRRRVDAGQPADILHGLTTEEIKIVLANLAYFIQCENPEGVVTDDIARNTIKNYLQDNVFGFGLEAAEAKSYSEMLIEAGEASLGLIVRKSPQEVGFYHRSFLEYLAACYISRLPLQKQLDLVRARFTDPQWQQVVLALLQRTERASDVEELIRTIKNNVSNPVERHMAQLISSEVAFGNFSCSTDLAKTLVQECFQEIEFGGWMPHRERLLKRMLSGLHSTRTREMVKSKLATWFPERISMYADVFVAMKDWPNCPEVVECLFKGLHSEHLGNKLSSAKALANIAKGDATVGNRLAKLARTAVDPDVRAASLISLALCWVDHKELCGLITEAGASLHPGLKFGSIVGKVEQGNHAASDMEQLLRFSLHEGGLDYHWQRDLESLVLKGWSNCQAVKQKCLKEVRQYPDGKRSIDFDLALSLLVKGYPQDDEVAECIANRIVSDEHLFSTISRLDTWDLISQNFRGHPVLVPAVDTWLQRVKTLAYEPDISYAALVGRTEIAKNRLLTMLDSGWVPFWAARSLLSGWGMANKEVASSLEKIAFGSNKHACQIAHLLPDIIEDKQECRERLIALLEDEDSDRLDFTVEGLIRLGDLQENIHVVDRILSILPRVDRDAIGGHGIVESLIAFCPWDERVRKLAKDELRRRNGAHIAVTKAYASDDEIRNLLIGMVNPLPVSLRQIIARRLGNEIENLDFALSLLQLYDIEHNPSIKSECSINYHRLLKLSGRDLSVTVEQLSRDIICYGPDYEARRQAAFCGLTTLDRLDIMLPLREKIGEDKPCAVPFKTVWLNTPFAKTILENWVKLKNVFRDEFWNRIGKYEGSTEIWEGLTLFADAYPSAREEGISFVESALSGGTLLRENMLDFLGRVCPRNQLLLKCCLDIICPTSKQGHQQHRTYPQIFTAAKLLGEHFEGEEEILAQLSKHIGDRFVPEGVVLALSYGWPDSQEFAKALRAIEQVKMRLDHGVWIRLCCIRKKPPDMLDMIFKLLKDMEEDPSLSNILESRHVNHSIISRIKKDETLQHMMQSKILNSPSSSEKASFPRLLAASGGLTTKLQEWCFEELCRQSSNNTFPEVGVDLVELRLMSVSNSLLTIIEPSDHGSI